MTTTKTAAEPVLSFSKLSADLATADAKARSTAADAGQARAERSAIAVNTIKAAYSESLVPETVRGKLLDAGVLKGTVSKIVTVLAALQEGVITPTDVKSLNGAYTTVKTVRATTAAAAAGPVGTGVTPPPAVVATTPKQALQIILNEVTNEPDVDKAYKIGGEWITRVTNAITALLKAKGKSDDEEEE